MYSKIPAIIVQTILPIINNLIYLYIVAIVEGKLREDYLINPHYSYYIREMRLHAYKQLLQSYRSLTLQYMADSFGVTVDYIDK